MVINPDTTIRYVNPAFQEQTGYLAQEVIGQCAPYPWWGKKTPQRHLKSLMACLKGGLKKREIPFTTKNGKQRLVEVTCVPFQDENANNLSLIMGVDITESKEFRDSMQSYIVQVTKLRETEHEQIARNLHEGILQSLAALNLTIESVSRTKKLNPENLFPKLTNLQKNINEVILEIRNISHELKSGVLDYLGLKGALETLVDNAKTQKQIQASFNTTGAERDLPSNVEATLYLIAHEAVRNAINHSEATQIKVDLYFSSRKVRLTISDNGKGFEVPERLMSFANLGKIGLVNMENWTLLLNGKLQVKSEINNGTMISVDVKV